MAKNKTVLSSETNHQPADKVEPRIQFIDVLGVHHVEGKIVFEGYDPKIGVTSCPMANSLEEFAAMYKFICDQFDGGWVVRDGKVVQV